MISGESSGHFYRIVFVYRIVFALIVLGMKFCVSCRLWAVILVSPLAAAGKAVISSREKARYVPMAMCALPFNGKYGIACACRFR